MRNFLILLFILSVLSCKEQPKKPAHTAEVETTTRVEESAYPDDLQEIFKAHGGLAQWKVQKSLQFDIPKEKGTETHMIDLRSRNERIQTNDYAIGFDGKPWVLDADASYKGNPEFYHNLMFYFYAMPFVLADDGIVYGETEDLVFEGVNYPGIKIGYNSGVGTSPKDEYFIHYDAKTHQMAWLGYTVTYRSGEKSDNIRWIHYDNWTDIDGLVLPKAITWHNYEGRKIMDARSTVKFENILLKETPLASAQYVKPNDAIYWEKPAE